MTGKIEDALDLLEKGRYEDAFAMLLPYAEQGDIRAQASVGFLYQTGLGVKRDIATAIKWLEEAAKQGSGEAAHNMGTLYLTCEPDLLVDKTKSRYWFERAKEMGFVVADSEWYQK